MVIQLEHLQADLLKQFPVGGNQVANQAHHAKQHGDDEQH